MLDNDMIEFLTYRNAMKSNYRKGVHALRCILNNRKQAETFAGSLGGVSLVLGVSQPDGNSEALRALLEGSAVIDQATLTWLKNWWPEQCGSWDTLAADQGRCNAIATDPFLWERVGASPVGAGKILAGLVGQDSRNFAAMQAVASSATAMQAVASSATAMQAVASSATAMHGVQASASSATAMQAVASSATAMQAVASSATAMQAVASSATAMQAVAVSPVAIAAIYRSDVALSAVDSEVSAAATFYGADSVAMGKAVVILAGLDPAGYADMSAVAASATAMSAVAASATAMSAVAASATAMSAVAASATAMSAVAASATAMSAVAASATAMSAVAASATAMSAVAASATAMSAVAANYVALVALYSNAEALSIAQGTTVGAAALAGAGSVATGKAAVKLAGLDPDDFADMAAVAASSTAYGGCGCEQHSDGGCGCEQHSDGGCGCEQHSDGGCGCLCHGTERTEWGQRSTAGFESISVGDGALSCFVTGTVLEQPWHQGDEGSNFGDKGRKQRQCLFYHQN